VEEEEEVEGKEDDEKEHSRTWARPDSQYLRDV
jgi:hypothetical protein